MGKHYAKKVKKSGYILKFVVVGIILFSIILFIYLYMNNKQEEKEPEKILNEAFTNLKNLDKDEINKTLDYDSLLSSLDEMIVSEENDTEELEKMLFESLTWTIENIEVEENEAVAIVEMTNKNFKNILTNWLKNIVYEKENGKVITNQVALDNFEDAISDETSTKTIIKKVQLTKEDNNWKIVINDDLRDLIFPGIDTVISTLEEYK